MPDMFYKSRGLGKQDWSLGLIRVNQGSQMEITPVTSDPGHSIRVPWYLYRQYNSIKGTQHAA